MLKYLNKSILALLLILYFLYLVLSRAPAAWGAWAIHQAVPQVWLTGVKGTLWKGSVGSAQVDLSKDHAILLGEMKWKLNPLTLLLMNPCMSIETYVEGQTLSGDVCHSLTGASTLSDIAIEFPFAVLKNAIGFEVAGQGSINIVKAKIKGTEIKDMEGQLTWQNARINPVEGWLSLGSFAAKLSENEQGGVKAKIFDLKSTLKTQFDADWTLAKGWMVKGTVSPQAGAPDPIKQGLQAFGEEIQPGTYKLVWP